MRKAQERKIWWENLNRNINKFRVPDAKHHKSRTGWWEQPWAFGLPENFGSGNSGSRNQYPIFASKNCYPMFRPDNSGSDSGIPKLPDIL